MIQSLYYVLLNTINKSSLNKLNWYAPKSGLVVTISLEFPVFYAKMSKLDNGPSAWLEKPNQDPRPAGRFYVLHDTIS
jgi:hypothetical protein